MFQLKQGRFTSISTAQRRRADRGASGPFGGHHQPWLALPLLPSSSSLPPSLSIFLSLWFTLSHAPWSFTALQPPSIAPSLHPFSLLSSFPSVFWIPYRKHTNRLYQYGLAFLNCPVWVDLVNPNFM